MKISLRSNSVKVACLAKVGCGEVHWQLLVVATHSGHLPPSAQELVSWMPMKEAFHKFSNAIADAMGTPAAFFMAFLALVVWGATGPFEGYSDTWQLIINTATTIVTFLMVFIIQNTQNRDSRALHLKLDELLRAVKGARDSFIDLEHITDEELDRLQKQFQQVREKREKGGERREKELHSPP